MRLSVFLIVLLLTSSAAAGDPVKQLATKKKRQEEKTLRMEQVHQLRAVRKYEERMRLADMMFNPDSTGGDRSSYLKRNVKATMDRLNKEKGVKPEKEKHDKHAK